MQRALETTIRCHNEMQWYLDRGKESSFLTLTYNNEDPVRSWTLNKMDMQKFIRSVRKKYKNDEIRYYGCGEYGENLERPHYHIILFGFQFDDMLPFTNDRGYTVYESEKLNKLWRYGLAVISEVTFRSINYACSHVTKILTNNQKTGEKIADNHYCGRLPEFSLRSMKPGLGYRWFKKYGKNVYDNDKIYINEMWLKPPRYYDKKREEETYKIVVMPTAKSEEEKGVLNVKEMSDMDQIKYRRQMDAKQREFDWPLFWRDASARYKKRKLYNSKVRRGKNAKHT